MIATLPMYAHPALAEAHARFWAVIRAELAARGIAAPETLSDTPEEAVWKRPDLVLSQTCGMPFRLGLHAEVTLVGTPDYELEGCPPGYYRSAIVVRADDRRQTPEAFQTSTFAFNGPQSQSGFAAPHAHFGAPGAWYQTTLKTGAHRSSAVAVAKGHADTAAIDAVTWRILVRHEPWVSALRVLDWTAPTPGLPYISAKGADQPVLFSAVANAMATLTAQDRASLGVGGLVYIPAEDYLAVGTSTKTRNGAVGTPAKG